MFLRHTSQDKIDGHGYLEGEWGREMELPGGLGFALRGRVAPNSKPKSRAYFIFGTNFFKIFIWDVEDFTTQNFININVLLDLESQALDLDESAFVSFPIPLAGCAALALFVAYTVSV